MSRVMPLVALVAGYAFGLRSARGRTPRTVVYSPTRIEASFTRAYADTRGADVQADGVHVDPIPARYTPATWRNTTPIDPATGTFGIGFTTRAGDVFLRLDIESGRHVAETYSEEIKVHSAMSSGARRSDVRSPDGTLKCEPTCASEAAERAL